MSDASHELAWKKTYEKQPDSIIDSKDGFKRDIAAAPPETLSSAEKQGIDLNRLLIQNPAATYFMRLETSEMEALGLPKGSVLAVDRSKTPANNFLAIISHEGQFLCRLMQINNGKTTFTNGTKEITPTEETQVIGTVTASIKIYDNNFSH